ncbi:MAG: entericidin [Candidatus Omnitrophota bacterium]
MGKITLAILAVIFLTGVLAGCNAMRGAGADLSDTGKHISNIGK